METQTQNHPLRPPYVDQPKGRVDVVETVKNLKGATGFVVAGPFSAKKAKQRVNIVGNAHATGAVAGEVKVDDLDSEVNAAGNYEFRSHWSV